MASDPIIVCSTHRLARSLRLAHGRRQAGAGLSRWQPLPAMPLSQWLDGVIGEALLCGEIAVENTPTSVPGAMQERVLWEHAIAACLNGDLVDSLFDLGGMADVAMDANRLLEAWRIALPGSGLTEETQQFLQWRKAFRKSCAKIAWLEPVRHFEWQIDQLAAGAGRLPPRLVMAGFDRLSPQEQRLFDVISARGVAIAPWHAGIDRPDSATRVRLADQDAECRATVAWVQQQLASNPQARLAIVAPELATVRAKLAALLDDVLHPAALTASAAEMPRCYDFSLGAPLAAQPVVAAALRLLGAMVGRRRLEQESISMLLLQPCWSATSETQGRAQLDAAMRADLPAQLSLDRLARYARKLAERGLGVSQLSSHLDAALQVLSRLAVRQLPSAWAASFRELLEAVGWPGDRGLSSHEFQARQACEQMLDEMRRLDVLLGGVTMPEALRRLNQACTDQIFQPRTEGDPGITVMGMLEAVGEPMDALWVMGMNDHFWPPPARPNPLLPAAAQRAVRAPNADAAVQAEFAGVVYRRLLNSARQIVFSHAHQDGDRELRPSPLIAGLPELGQAPLARTLAESMIADLAGSVAFESDHRAPPVTEGERVPGGAGLLKAQAVCPAWAYYQFRLGARKLDSPVDGLDAAGRGSLLHAALESFWQGRGSSALSAMTAEALDDAVALAVDQALARFDVEREEPLPAGFTVLEGERLQQVLHAWLAFEKTRTAAFEVQACEREVRLEIEGIAVKLVIDRIDELDDGRLVIIDYKTGATLDYKNWSQARMTEPQLPIYASLALAGERVAAVAFAKVRPDDARFSGIAADDELLPGVLGLDQDKSRKDFPAELFPDWASLLGHWKASVEAIAAEVRSGVAAVSFSDEKALEYCEVKPLLRLPERKLLFERAQAGGLDSRREMTLGTENGRNGI